MKTEGMAVALCVALLGGCATEPRMPQIARESPVAFVVVKSQPTGSAKSVRDSTLSQNASTGAKSGAAAGALSGLACGPAFIFCSPIGALMGAGIGLGAGAAIGLAEDMPKDKRDQLDQRMQRLQQSVDPLLELRMNVLEEAGKHWQITDDISGRVVTLEVQNLFLTSDRHKNISLVMQVSVAQRGGETGDDSHAAPKRYSIVSQGSSLAAWLDERSELPESELRSACQRLATQIVSELAFN